MLLIVCVLGLTIAGASAQTVNCAKALPGSRLSARYNETIAHAVHSMTVAGLRLFSDKAAAVNFVPTVNQDLSHVKSVLDHAPEVALGNDFNTLSMNIIDNILSSLGNEKDGLGRYFRQSRF